MYCMFEYRMTWGHSKIFSVIWHLTTTSDWGEKMGRKKSIISGKSEKTKFRESSSESKCTRDLPFQKGNFCRLINFRHASKLEFLGRKTHFLWGAKNSEVKIRLSKREKEHVKYWRGDGKKDLTSWWQFLTFLRDGIKNTTLFYDLLTWITIHYHEKKSRSRVQREHAWIFGNSSVR